MQKRTRSILEELEDLHIEKDKSRFGRRTVNFAVATSWFVRGRERLSFRIF